MTLRAVIFDFDGVLAESEAAKTMAFAEFFAEWPDHVDVMMRFHREHRSAPRAAKVAELARLIGREGDARFIDAQVAALSRLIFTKVAAAELVPGARELLGQLASHVLVAVASVTPEDDLQRLLGCHDLARFVNVAYGDPPTPKRAAIAEVVRRVGGDPARVAFVGDSPADRDAAHACGVRFIHRSSGVSTDLDGAMSHQDLFSVGVELRALL